MTPLPSEMPVLAGRDRYLSDNGWTVEAYDAPWTKASAFGVDFAVPNTKSHRDAIMLHDLHHVATGYGTDLAGEGEISAWELRGGLRGAGLYVSSIITLGALAGLFVAPARTLRAFRAARDAKTLWTLGLPYEDLLAMSVDELRARVGAPSSGVSRGPAGLHKNAPRAALATA